MAGKYVYMEKHREALPATSGQSVKKLCFEAAKEVHGKSFTKRLFKVTTERARGMQGMRMLDRAFLGKMQNREYFSAMLVFQSMVQNPEQFVDSSSDDEEPMKEPVD